MKVIGEIGMDRPSHIFVVGSYRSGTSLVRSVLDNSEQVALCGETHFLNGPKTFTSFIKGCFNQVEQPGFYSQGYLLKNPPTPGSWRALAQIGDISTDEGVQKLVDHIFDNSPWRWWTPERYSRAEFRQKLCESDRTARSFFDLLLGFYAGHKLIRGEKTPNHIHHVPTLLEWFPNAKIIHTFRDVRAVFVSQQKKKFKQEREKLSPRQQFFRKSAAAHEMFMSLNVIIHWLRVVQLHHQYQQRYPDNYYFCRFEDLISDPETQLGKLCDYLGIELTQAMLHLSFQNSSFVPRGQVQGFDTSAVDRWREYLSPALNRWFVFWGRKHLLEFGYQP
jgi:hypothetical protein